MRIGVFILSFRDVLDPKKIEDLDRLADSKITVRGYNVEEVKPGSDLRRTEFFLPVNEIAGDYCPTHRYSYIHKVEKRTPKSTWAGLRGRIVDSTYTGMFEELGRYVSSADLKQLYVIESLSEYAKKAVDSARAEITCRKQDLMDPPTNQKIDKFLEELGKILRYESELCGTLLDYKISSKEDIRLKSEFVLLFPYNLKCKIRAPDLGFSGSAEPDFIYSNKVIGDVKTGPWRESFRLTLAAYALAYENETRKKMNLGIIVNPVLMDTRTVPLYTCSEIEIIEDVFRKAALANRDQKLTMIKSGSKPPLPERETVCASGPCGYHDECWVAKVDT
jgi:CRISPR/Cas system-associated exonuclease Cas4 (RecB family)